MDNTDAIENLYQQFRDSLSKRGEMYFEADDLIDIFDYANESGDTYICRAVLSIGERLYPDSDELLVRQGLLYAGDVYNERESLHRFIQDHADRTGTMWDILSLYLIPKDDADAIDNAFEEFVSTHKLDEDEESVQFFNAVMYHNRIDWLTENIDRIRKICQYEYTLLYDVAQISRENGHYGLAIQLLDEMTDAEPFSIDLWLLLAKSYDDAGRHDDAATALDYARALDSENMMLRMYECERIINYNLAPVTQQIEMLERLRDYVPEKSFINAMLVQLYKQTGNTEAALKLNLPTFEQSPGSMSLLAEMMSIDPDNADKYMEMFEKAYASEQGEAMSDDVFGEEAAEGVTLPLQGVMVKCAGTNPELSYKIIRMLLRIGMSEDAERSFMMALHLSGRNEEAYNMINEMFKDRVLRPDKVLALSPLIGAVMLSSGHHEEAGEWAAAMAENIRKDEAQSYMDAMLTRGVLYALFNIKSFADRWDELSDEQKANPLNLILDEAFRE